MSQTMTKTAATLLALVVAAVAMMIFAAPASAFELPFGRGGSDNEKLVKVENTNSASITNTMYVKANTGDNDSEGGDGEEGGNGGDVEGAKNGKGGHGGNGGHGGLGGLILTGDATAYGTINNDVNYNKTKIQGCGCDDEEESPWARFFGGRGGDDEDKTKVENTNTASVSNDMKVKANTGDNDVDGGDGDEGGNGGDVEGEDEDKDVFNRFFSWFNKGGKNNGGQGGHGGAGGHGGHGGVVTTGEAYSDGLIMNVVNRNVTRIGR